MRGYPDEMKEEESVLVTTNRLDDVWQFISISTLGLRPIL